MYICNKFLFKNLMLKALLDARVGLHEENLKS